MISHAMLNALMALMLWCFLFALAFDFLQRFADYDKEDSLGAGSFFASFGMMFFVIVVIFS